MSTTNGLLGTSLTRRPRCHMFEAGRFTAENTESTESAEMDGETPFTGEGIGCAIEMHRLHQLADGIDRFKF